MKTTNSIFGYSWENIQEMQNKEYQPKTIQFSSKAMANENDRLLLEELGLLALREKQLWGVLDRLANSELISREQAM